MATPSKSHGRKSISASLTPRDLMAEPTRLKGAWAAKIITLFPDAFPGVLGASLTGKALQEGKWTLDAIDLRIFGEGKHRNVDDTPYGGGAGMVLRADIVGKALDFAKRGTSERAKWPIVYLSPRGKPFNQAKAAEWAQADGITMLCGRFEGVDQRVLDHYEIEEVSLGDFVLTGGEIAAQAMIDATVRLLPNVLGNSESTEEESFSDGISLEHPQYTRPAEWRGMGVPEILTSGDHAKVDAWRRKQSDELTKSRRPDLWAKREDGEG